MSESQLKPTTAYRPLIRVDRVFFQDMIEINVKREQKGLKRLSDRKILELIRRHSYWSPIMEDIILYERE